MWYVGSGYPHRGALATHLIIPKETGETERGAAILQTWRWEGTMNGPNLPVALCHDTLLKDKTAIHSQRFPIHPAMCSREGRPELIHSEVPTHQGSSYPRCPTDATQ